MAGREAAPRTTCRTPDEAFSAGWDDGLNDTPLTDSEITSLASLLRPLPAEAAS